MTRVAVTVHTESIYGGTNNSYYIKNIYLRTNSIMIMVVQRLDYYILNHLIDLIDLNI